MSVQFQQHNVEITERQLTNDCLWENKMTKLFSPSPWMWNPSRLASTQRHLAKQTYILYIHSTQRHLVKQMYTLSIHRNISQLRVVERLKRTKWALSFSKITVNFYPSDTQLCYELLLEYSETKHKFVTQLENTQASPSHPQALAGSETLPHKGIQHVKNLLHLSFNIAFWGIKPNGMHKL